MDMGGAQALPRGIRRTPTKALTITATNILLTLVASRKASIDDCADERGRRGGPNGPDAIVHIGHNRVLCPGRRCRGQRPPPRSTSPNVRNNTLVSSQSDQFST